MDRSIHFSEQRGSALVMVVLLALVATAVGLLAAIPATIAYNTFASVWHGKRRMRNRLHRFYSSQWRAYAREFLGETCFLPADTVKVSFNAWFSDENYRRRLAEELGLEHADRGIDEVSSDGGGSSFSGQDFQNRGRDMAVLDRWRHFIDDPNYVAAFDEETVELSRKIFGDVTAQGESS